MAIKAVRKLGKGLAFFGGSKRREKSDSVKLFLWLSKEVKGKGGLSGGKKSRGSVLV